jgi:hypothetical protein
MHLIEVVDFVVLHPLYPALPAQAVQLGAHPLAVLVVLLAQHEKVFANVKRVNPPAVLEVIQKAEAAGGVRHA